MNSKFIKPGLAKGTRDFTPKDMRLRNFIIETIKSHFEVFGFEQIETPAVENLETLTGKYGEEGDKLIFKILNSGDYLKNAEKSYLIEGDSDKLVPFISEKALRYDLTVPFARYVVMHRNDITFPFRRYQVQPVWRADRPQKGRYREFYQCDADVIGSNSLLLEAEFVQLIDKVFSSLKIKAELRLNNRKILYGFCEKLGIEKKFRNFTVILDKLDKKSWEELSNEFNDNGFSKEVIESAEKLIKLSGNNLSKENIEKIKDIVSSSSIGQQGIDELLTISEQLMAVNTESLEVKLDLTLARGLDYYTGAIIEVLATEHQIGSICGGGRYDDLTGVFGLENVSGIGISFGIDRIFDILQGKDLSEVKNNFKVLLINFGKSTSTYNLKMLNELRNKGIVSEYYPDSDKLKKQFKYADQKNFDFVLMAGEEEAEKAEFSLKDLKSGSQRNISSGLVVDSLLKHL